MDIYLDNYVAHGKWDRNATEPVEVWFEDPLGTTELGTRAATGAQSLFHAATQAAYGNYPGAAISALWGTAKTLSAYKGYRHKKNALSHSKRS